LLENKDVQLPLPHSPAEEFRKSTHDNPNNYNHKLQTSFILGLTLLQTGGISNLQNVSAAFLASIISLSVFVIIKRRSNSPLLDFRLLRDRTLLPSYLILTAVGITMFMAYPSIVQLVRSRVPLGFGGNAIDAANIRLPFMVTFLILASTTPVIINKIGNKKPIIIGGLISLMGSIGLLVYHSTEFAISANLAIIATGLSMALTATWNIVVSESAKEFIGISTAAGALLMAIRPAVAGVYMENHNTIAGIQGSYPTLRSYDMVFLTSALLSGISTGFALKDREGL
jgi:hypothetical protein